LSLGPKLINQGLTTKRIAFAYEQLLEEGKKKEKRRDF
jgi:hypothetical protein